MIGTEEIQFDSSYFSALDLLLENGANPSLPLGAPIGSALCAAVDTTCEGRRSNDQRLSKYMPLFGVHHVQIWSYHCL